MQVRLMGIEPCLPACQSVHAQGDLCSRKDSAGMHIMQLHGPSMWC